MATLKDFMTFPYVDMKLQDHIAIWERKVPDELCDRMIEHIDNSDLTPNMGNDKTLREDACVFLLSNREEDLEFYNEINQFLSSALAEYLNQYSSLRGAFFTNPEIKLQKTEPGQGYHLWHCERNALQFVMRELVWSIYLNDIPEGEGETEFIYQKFRYQPKKGDILIWPASYTHTHRGNPPYTHNKYIATGWFLHTPVGGIKIMDDCKRENVPVKTFTDSDV